MTTAYGGDGRALTADFLSPGNATFTHAVDYDSAGRPVKISSGTTVFWEAKVPSGGFASYDALGRVPSMQADTGKVASQRVYGAYNGALLSELKFFTTTGDIFRTAGATYQGTKLAGYDDNVTRTRYANTYWTSGRVKRLDASPISGYTPGTMTQDYTHDFTFNGVTNLASAIEEKNARTSGQTKEKRTKTPAYNSTNDQMSSLTTDLAVNGTLTSSSTDTFTYDALGRMATRGGTAEVFTYDLQGHLTQVKRAGVVAETLAYGPTGELLYRQVGSQYSFYVGEYATVRASTVGNSTTPGAAVNASTIEVDAHVLWAGARIASKVVTGTSGRTLYYYRTRLGSVIATSLAGGTLGAQYRYTPYGELDKVVNETASTRSDLGYTGALRLTGNLVYLKNRVYHAELKVFLQPDSVDRLRYAYVLGDPINLDDPSGLRVSNGDGPLVQPAQVGTPGGGAGGGEGDYPSCGAVDDGAICAMTFPTVELPGVVVSSGTSASAAAAAQQMAAEMQLRNVGLAAGAIGVSGALRSVVFGGKADVQRAVRAGAGLVARLIVGTPASRAVGGIGLAAIAGTVASWTIKATLGVTLGPVGIFVAQVVSGAIAGGAASVLMDIGLGQDINWERMAVSAIAGGVSGALPGAIDAVAEPLLKTYAAAEATTALSQLEAQIAWGKGIVNVMTAFAGSASSRVAP